MNTLDIQKALKAAGFDPGPLDGARGTLTIQATKAFQQANGLTADGIIDPATEAKLFSGAKPASTSFIPSTQPWMIEAFKLVGLKEDTSPRSNPVLIGWGKALKINYSNDETPWCGLFVAHCIGSQLPDEPMPTNPLSARGWASLGVETKPQPGAVIVFWRGSPSSGLGHVGFYVAEDANAYHILGGNQSDKVSVTRMPKNRFLKARWPKTAPAPTGASVTADASGKISTNEQ